MLRSQMNDAPGATAICSPVQELRNLYLGCYGGVRMEEKSHIFIIISSIKFQVIY